MTRHRRPTPLPPAHGSRPAPAAEDRHSPPSAPTGPRRAPATTAAQPPTSGTDPQHPLALTPRPPRPSTTAPTPPATADDTPQGPPTTRPLHPHAAAPGRPATAGGERPSPTGTAPPRTPTLATAPAPSPGGRRPGATGLSRRPADNRPGGRASRGRGPASPAVPARGARTTPAAGRAPLVVPRAADRPTRRPLPPIRPTDRFAELLLAVLSGQRPVHAMLRHTAGQAYDELVRLAERGPLRTRGARPVVRDIGWFEPREGAIEVFARIGAGDRLRAMAFRLERGRDLRWRCTAVELGGPRPQRAGTR